MKRKFIEVLGIGFLIVLMIVFMGPTNATEFDERKYNSCAACHGTNGEGRFGTKLSGRSADYIEKRLIQYKNKEKVGNQSAIMWAQAGGLTEQDIRELAKYIESL